MATHKVKNRRVNLLRQRKLAKEVIANNGKGTMKEAMTRAGYSAGYAKNPHLMIKTKSWQELMDQFLPEDMLATKHQELLNATTLGHAVFPTKMTDEEIGALLLTVNCMVKKIMHGQEGNHAWFWARDNRSMKDGLDMAYKLRGKYAPEKMQIVESEIDKLSNAELAARIKKIKDFLLKR